MKCLLGLLWKQANVFVKISPPRYGRPRGIFVRIARDFQIILKLEDLTLDFMWVDFYIEI